MKSVFKFSLTVRWSIILIFFPLFVSGQSSWGKLRFVNNSSLEESARSLYERATKNSYDSNFSLFQAIAFPVDRLSEAEVAVDYVNNEFIVKIGDRELYPDLPDWQLVPIARFANSSYQSVFTSAGDPQNEEAQLKYHPAFLDNLLGLRLLQAHLLFINPELLGEVPKNENGNYILAPSEEGLLPPPNPNKYRTLFNEIKKNNINYKSYILTDRDLDIRFDIDGDDLSFSDNPYYYFFEDVVASKETNGAHVDLEYYYNEIEINAKVFLRDKYTPDLNPRTNLKGLLKVLADNKQNEIFNPYTLHYINDILEQMNVALSRLPGEKTAGTNPPAMNNRTSSFKKNWDLLKRYNPAVYSAVENISHWAAFFRYIRLSNPDNWTLFFKKVESITVKAPAVRTPTSFVESG
ncbi:MAG: hypothetical protein LBP72_03310, partial [Dysgonamonadaceae bacterium]|nr:hypothetical protein [Dysgonamonadaceae bacterium]